MTHSPVTLLIADDDLDDCLLIEMALRQVLVEPRLHFVHDGTELLDYFRRAETPPGADVPLPDMILLDLNMPRLSGLDALAEIKADPVLRRVPVVVFTTSQSEADTKRCYELGVSAFVTKPMNFGGLTESFQSLSNLYLQGLAPPPTA